jgi:yecA family protein
MEQLDDFLQRGPGDISDFHMLDGFITAIALLPDPLTSALWHPNILGGADDAETAELVAAAEQVGVLGLLVRHWSTVVLRCVDRRGWEIPACDDESESSEIWWALGVREGLDRTEDLWELLMSHARCAELIEPVRRMAERARLTPGVQRLPLPPEERAELRSAMIAGVNQLYRELRRRR